MVANFDIPKGGCRRLLTQELQVIERLYPNMPLVPVQGKAPKDKGWQNNPKTASELIKVFSQDTHYTGFGVLLGYPFDWQGHQIALVAVDIDGEGAQEEVNKILNGRTIERTVAWTSGRHHRSQHLFFVKEDDFEKLRTKKIKSTRTGDDGKVEMLELRWKGLQSVLAPSFHPTTGSYKWIRDFEEDAIEPLPEYFKRIMAESEPTPLLTSPIKNRWEEYLDKFEFRRDKVPLEKCLSREHRELISTGVSEGSRDNTAVEIALDLIGTANYLDLVGQTYDGTPQDLLSEFCSRCNPPLSQKDFERIYRSAEGSNPTPSCKEDGVKSAVASFFWEQEKPQNARQQNTTKIINHPAFEPLPQSEILAKIDSLIEQNLSKSKLRLALSELSKQGNIHINELWRLYHERSEELESDHTSELADIHKILDAKSASIDLTKILPKNLAEPLIRLAKALNVKPEVYFTALLTGVSSIHHNESELMLVPYTNFIVKPNLFAGIVADPSQKKSPVMKAMVEQPLLRLQAKAREKYEEQLREYKKKKQRYDSLKKSSKNLEQLENEFPEGEPDEPTQKVYFTSDATIEGITYQLAKYPEKPIQWYRDELNGLFGSLNQYKGGKGSDIETLLSLYDGSSMTVLRAKGIVASVENALVSVLGSIQPEVLRKQLRDGDDSNGLFSRFLFVSQPLTATLLDPNGQQISIKEMIDELYQKMDDVAKTKKCYRLSPPAQKAFIEAHNDFEQKKVHISTSKGMRNIFGKAGGCMGKIAINLHCVKHCSNGEDPPDEISLETMQSAIALTHFYNQQVLGLYEELVGSSPVSAELAKILSLATDWIKARDVQQAVGRKAGSPDEIRQRFITLAEMGLGVIEGKGTRLKFKSSQTVETVETVDGSYLQLEPLPSKVLSKTVETVDTFSKKSTVFDESPPTGKSQNTLEKTSTVSTVRQKPDSERDKPVDESSTVPSTVDESSTVLGKNSELTEEDAIATPSDFIHRNLWEKEANENVKTFAQWLVICKSSSDLQETLTIVEEICNKREDCGDSKEMISRALVLIKDQKAATLKAWMAEIS